MLGWLWSSGDIDNILVFSTFDNNNTPRHDDKWQTDSDVDMSSLSHSREAAAAAVYERRRRVLTERRIETNDTRWHVQTDFMSSLAIARDADGIVNHLAARHLAKHEWT